MDAGGGDDDEERAVGRYVHEYSTAAARAAATARGGRRGKANCGEGWEGREGEVGKKKNVAVELFFARPPLSPLTFAFPPRTLSTPSHTAIDARVVTVRRGRPGVCSSRRT